MLKEFLITEERINQNFYCIDQKFTYFLRSEAVLEGPVDPQILQKAVETAFQRYPYFSATLLKDEHGYYVAPNDAPHKIICDDRNVILNSPEVNGHLIVVSCYRNSVVFNICHCITDGRGVLPLIKTILYYYLTEKYGIEMDTEDICLADTPFFPDENAIPARETETPVGGAAPDAAASKGVYFRLSDSSQVNDDVRTEYRFTVGEADFMDLCRNNGTSPNALICSLLTRSVWKEVPDLEENVTINLCVDMRTALNCPHYHFNMTTCVPVVYDASMKTDSLPDLCAFSRKDMRAGAVPEDMRLGYEKSVFQAEKIRKIKKEEMKHKIMHSHMHGSGGFFSCSILVSYWGPNQPGNITPHIKSMFTTIDFIPDGGIAVEIMHAGGKFCFSFLQDFSSDIYFRNFIRELEELGLTVENEDRMPMPAPGIHLP